MHILDRFHLSYCTNIHPGRDWEETLNQLRTHTPAIKASLSRDQPFGLGLRLSDLAARELLEGDRLAEFVQWLKSEGLYVFTINGFPFGNFHGEVVKDRVHEPDWTHPQRLEYTMNLARILSALLPYGGSGGISTSPVSYRHWHSDAREVMLKAAHQYCELAEYLEEQEVRSGTYVHLDLEPEPDGLLERTGDVLSFYKDYLYPVARQRAANQGLPELRGEERVQRYLCLCYDVCHYALAFEEPEETLRSMKEHGIRVGKVQLSAALALRSEEVGHDQDPFALMEQLHESTYLHQVTQKDEEGVRTWPDIPELLRERPAFEELRAHFHVPVFCERFGTFRSTSDYIVRVLDYLLESPDCEQLEVETYTWQVLPEALKIPLTESIIREITWCRNHLEKSRSDA